MKARNNAIRLFIASIVLLLVEGETFLGNRKRLPAVACLSGLDEEVKSVDNVCCLALQYVVYLVQYLYFFRPNRQMMQKGYPDIIEGSERQRL